MRYAVTVLLFLCGCQSPAALPKAWEQGTSAFFASALDQARWERIVGSTDGHVNDPGYRLSGGIEYFAEARLTGVDGDIRLRADGGATGEITPEARAAILELVTDEELADKILRALSADPGPE